MSLIRAVQRQAARGFIYGLDLTFASVTRVDVSPGYCRDSTDVADISVSSTLQALMTVSGPGGLRAGLTEAASTWYYVYVIASESGANPVTTLIDTSPTAPVLPAGYDLCRRVGSIYNNSGSDIQSFVQSRRGGDMREYAWRITVTTAMVLSGGASTSRVTVDCSALVPPTSRGFNVMGKVTTTLAAAIGYLHITTVGSASATHRINIAGAASVSKESNVAVFMPTSAQNFEYEVSGASTTLDAWVLGYAESL